jgi:hypothetical protein
VTDDDFDETAIIAAGIRSLGWGDAVSKVEVLSRDVARTTGLVRDGQRFIMKQFPDTTCVARLRERIAVLGQLIRARQPVPRVVTAEPVGFACSPPGSVGWVVVTEYRPGDRLVGLSLSDFEELGARVGELHLRLREAGVGPAWVTHASCSLRACRPGGPSAGPVRGHLHHGDLHLGNVIKESTGYAFIDFDEMEPGNQINDVAALLGVPRLHRYPRQALAVMRGYTRALNDPMGTDLVYGPELPLALARRFRHLATIQWAPRTDLVTIADDLTEYASETSAGLDGWLARARIPS